MIRNEDGVIAVLAALLLPVLAGMAALVVDLGQLWRDDRYVQNCVDAAALAGAWDLPNPATAQATALTYLAAQSPDHCSTVGASAPTYSFIDRNGDGTVDAFGVTVSRPTSFGLGRLLGINSKNVQRLAVAGKFTPSGFLGMVPFGVQMDPGQPCNQDVWTYTLGGVPLAPGTTYTIKYSAPGSGSPGNFQALGLGGTGADVYLNNIISGYQAPVSSCGTVTTETGNMVGKTVDGEKARLAIPPPPPLDAGQCSLGPVANPTSPKWYLCPNFFELALIPPLAPGHTDTQVLTFAWFDVQSYQTKGKDAGAITGIFLNVAGLHAPPGGWQGNTPWNPSSSLPVGVKLIT